MLTFYPEFEADEESEVEVILMIDSSNSMKDSSHRDAKKAALLVLHLMDPTWRFNVVSFGTGIVWRERERENLIYGYSSVLFLQTYCSGLFSENVFSPFYSCKQFCLVFEL